MIQSQKVQWILRIAIAMCFIGHGSFGIITKQIWCNYFAVAGIGQTTAYQWMPVIGTIDILMGIIMLVYPIRAIPVWLVIWGLFTALLRPLSGEPFAEFVERAGNFGAPLAMLFLAGFPKNNREMFQRMDAATIQPDEQAQTRLRICLRIVVFLLLLGHGWLNLIEKKGLLNQYSSLGFSNPDGIAQIVGIAEIIAAFFILIKPVRQFLFIVFIWKMASELLYPHYGLLEWIERGGSYGSLMALWLITNSRSASLGGSRSGPQSGRDRAGLGMVPVTSLSFTA